MKKTFLFLMMTLLFCIGSSAFNDVKAQTTTTRRFIDPYNNISISQQYYTNEMINHDGSGNITSMTFNVVNFKENNSSIVELSEGIERNIEVWIKNADANSSFDNNTMVTFNQDDKYYSGNIKLLAGLVTVTLKEPFNYDGNDILVCVNDITKTATDYAVYFEAIEDCNALYASTYKNGEINYVYNPTYTNTDGELDIDQGNASTTISQDNAASIQFTFDGESGGEGGETQNLTLSVDKETIEADGTDAVNFTVKQGETDITSDCEIWNGTTKLSGNTFSTTTADTYTFYAKYGELTSENITITAVEPIVLSASKTNLEADGTDAVIFTVKQGETDITSDCEIWNGTTKLSGNTFSTTTADTYTFYAKYGELISENITITATEPAIESIVLSASKTNLEADGTDAVNFTVKQGETDITSDCEIWNGTTKLSGNTFSTSTAGTYTFYAKYGELISENITITATEPESEESEGNGETIYNKDGSVTYNKGLDNEYTLLAVQDPNTGVVTIKEDNVYYHGSGTELQIARKDNNKPNAATVLTIPEKVLFQTEEVTDWVTVTKIADYAFDNLFEYNDYDSYEPGNELNDNFTGLIIPSTIEEIGTYTFGFEMEGSIICYAQTPPALNSTATNNPFLSSTYNNTILYVLPESIDEYEEARGWGTAAFSGYYFKNIAPLTIPTFVAKEDNNWNNGNNWRRYTKNGDGSYTEEYGMPNAGEDVLINGDAIIPAGYTANVGAINIVSGGITIKDGGQLIHTNAGVTVTVEKEIKGYNTTREGIAWNTISSPIAVMTPTNKVNGLLNGAYDLYYYDEPTHYWINHEQGTNNFTTLDAGRGYLYANENDVTLKFNGVISYDNVSFDLDASSEYEGLLGFNLIGNPFTHDIYMGGNIYSENLVIEGYYSLSQEGQWGAVKAYGNAITPCQGILVQTSKEETINIVKAAAAPARSAQAALNITVVNEQYEDNAYVIFNDGKGLNKVGHMNENIPMVYVIDNNEKFAIANIDDANEIALGFEAMTMGEYTIAVKAQDCKFNNMILTDNMTGEKTNLLTDSYTFMATTSDSPDRFTLTLNNDNDNDFIYIHNNEMIINNIEGNGLVQIYDMMGRSVATYNVSGSANISMETLSNGVYVVRMTDANGVKTQKVVNN
ncbi:MAG: T9SS type A sorting domain-containing protein [Bacteroidales bacterium]|nr:T9SS type A sorting domain-containing protein [Bacteroidales bacterium]